MYKGKYNKKRTDPEKEKSSKIKNETEQGNKRKKLPFLIVIIAVIILCLTAAVFTVNRNRIDYDRVAASISNEYASLLNYSGESTNPLLAELFYGFDVEIISVERSGNDYLVECKLSNHDVSSAFSSLQGEISEDSYNNFTNILVDRIRKQQKLSYETVLTMSVLEDGNYRIYFTEEQLDMAMGGFLAYSRQILGEE